MKLSITPQAQNWFKEEIALSDGFGIRFFGKVYGKTDVHDGFSIGMSVAQPENIFKEVTLNGITFFIEETDDWFFKGYDLVVDYDPELDEPSYHFHSES
ncbi:MAG: HesB/YadR/YfhF family protein [Enterococcus sp.]